VTFGKGPCARERLPRSFSGNDTVVYVLDASRSHRVPEDHYPDKAGGVLMVDRYNAYKALAQVKNGLLILAFCWAHVRRDFVRVGKGWPALHAWAHNHQPKPTLPCTSTKTRQRVSSACL
jgi:hypothetical protein